MSLLSITVMYILFVVFIILLSFVIEDKPRKPKGRKGSPKFQFAPVSQCELDYHMRNGHEIVDVDGKRCLDFGRGNTLGRYAIISKER